ncbi:MAG: GNAT family N-acetyltransferase [Pseudomonadota bacterium]
MNPADFASLHKRAFEPEARGWRAAEFEELLSNPAVFWAGDCRAFALVRVAGDEAELLTLACDPDHRRKGLASACLSGLMEEACALGARRFFLEVAADNLPALGLYEKMGFEQVARRAGYYRRSETKFVDAIVFQKRFGITSERSEFTTT